MSEGNKKQLLPEEKLVKVAGGVPRGFECWVLPNGQFEEYYDKGFDNGCPRYEWSGSGWVAGVWYGEDKHHCRQCQFILGYNPY